jgi:threonine dehydrogenase-like Zn-dependent dehydrogenase
VRMVAPGGTAVWIGSAADEVPLRGLELVHHEKRVQGAYSYTDHDFVAALGLLAAGRLELASWSKVYPLAEGASLFTRLLTHEEPCIKALLDPTA